jgi:transcriptional regulator with XRE-family HTH domain
MNHLLPEKLIILRKLIYLKGEYTQRELADILQTNVNLLNLYLNGHERSLSKINQKRLYDFLGITEEALDNIVTKTIPKEKLSDLLIDLLYQSKKYTHGLSSFENKIK